MAKTFDLSVLFKVIDKATRPMQKIGTEFSTMGRKASVSFRLLNMRLSKFDRQLTDIDTKIKSSGLFKMGNRMKDIGKSMSLFVTLPLVGAGAAATKVAVDFESAFTGVKKTVTATKPEFEALRKGLIDMTKEMPTSFVELAGIAELAGQFAIPKENILGFTRVIADLAETTDILGDEGAATLAQFANITGMAKTDFDRLGSTIAGVGNNAAETESKILSMASRLAVGASRAGMSEAEIIALSATLTSLGIAAEKGGSAFSKVMFEISKSVELGDEKLSGFAFVSGKTVKQFTEDWRKDASPALFDFIKGLGEIEGKGITAEVALDKLGFGGLRVAESLGALSEATDLYKKELELANKFWEENTALTEEAALRYGTMAARFSIAKNRVILLANAFGGILAPAILKITELLIPVIDWMEQLSDRAKIIIVIIGTFVAAIGPLLLGLWFLATTLSSVVTILGSFGVVLPSLAAIGAILFALTAPALAVAAAIGGIAAAIYQITTNWEDLTRKGFFKDLVGWTKELVTSGPAFDSAVPVSEGGPQIGENIFSFARNQTPQTNSQTDINITVSAEGGAEARVEKVDTKKGKSNVNVFSEAYTGAN